MTLLEKLYGFLNHYFFSIFRRNSSEQKLLETATDSSNEQVVVETNIEEVLNAIAGSVKEDSSPKGDGNFPRFAG